MKSFSIFYICSVPSLIQSSVLIQLKFKILCSKSASLKVQDYEPAFALRKIALLYEKKLNEEVAHVIREISLGTLRKIYLQFPIDMFIEGIPHTLSIVSVLYSRLLSSVGVFILNKIFFFNLSFVNLKNMDCYMTTVFMVLKLPIYNK